MIRLILLFALLANISHAQDSLIVRRPNGKHLAGFAVADTIRIPTTAVDSLPFAFEFKPATAAGTVVFFEMRDGKPVQLRVEGQAPYSMWGDVKETYGPHEWGTRDFGLEVVIWSGIRNFSSFRARRFWVDFYTPKPSDPDPEPEPEPVAKVRFLVFKLRIHPDGRTEQVLIEEGVEIE